MTKTSVAVALGGLLLMSAVTAESAAAQGWTPGAEITGHGVRVETQGVVNTVYFDPGGTARIVSASGQEYPGNWFVEANQLCLQLASGARECWAYQGPFVAGQAVQLTSTCGPSTWTALSTAEPLPPPPPPPVEERAGERG
jgi:hypothetical protein